MPETLALRYRIGGSERTAVVAREWGREGATYWLCADAGSDDVVPAQTIASDERFERIDGVRADGPTFPGPRYLDELRLELDGVRSSYNVELRRTGQPADAGWHGAVDATSVVGALVRSDALALDVDVVEPGAAGSHDGGGTGPTTPVPGTVTHVAVEVGDTVVAGQALVVLEAMKMEHTIRADADGTVAELHVTLGQSVDAHTVVATVTPS